MKARYNKQIR